VIVDFTRPEVVMNNLRQTLVMGISAVVGTTGFTPENLAELDNLAKENHCGVLIAPNFSVGAVLMMKLATEAIRYMPKAEIIELHHDQKLDAPSGTASLTAERLAAARGGFIQQGHPDEKEKWPGARGAAHEGIHVHSVRLPGYVAHQEVLFGGLGETLTIRHDSLSRESFMPGVLMACRKMGGRIGLLYGLEHLMD
jgi:4-hydroxy-tetrahydrodipicolinate reductase